MSTSASAVRRPAATGARRCDAQASQAVGAVHSFGHQSVGHPPRRLLIRTAAMSAVGVVGVILFVMSVNILHDASLGAVTTAPSLGTPSFAPNRDLDGHAATSSTHDVDAADRVTGRLIFTSSSPQRAATISRMFEGSGNGLSNALTLTTFWGLKATTGRGANASFYHGRAVPSFDWVIVFIASWLRHAQDPLCQEPSSSSCDGGRRLVFFCDAVTASALFGRLATVRQGLYLRQLLGCACVYFVVVRDPSLEGRDEEEVLRGLQNARHDSNAVKVVEACVVTLERPAYMDAPWITSVPNGANNFRFAFYRDWIEEWSTRRRRRQQVLQAISNVFVDSQVILSDNTDVAFQRNPFASIGLNGCFPPLLTNNASSALRRDEGNRRTPWVTFTLEDASKTFHNEKYNRRWLGCYGKEPLRSMDMQRQRVSCAGVTAGNGEGVLRYCRAQIAELTRPDLMDCAANVIRATLDQATHNVILHRWFRWAAEAYRRETGEALSLRHRGEMLKLNRWVLTKEHQNVPQDRRFFAIFTSSADADMDNTSDSHWIPCTFHGNFGKPHFAPSPSTDGVVRPTDDDGLATIGTVGGGGGGGANLWFSMVHQYTSNRIPAMMERMQRRYLA
jgi:hypothetical protein